MDRKNELTFIIEFAKENNCYINPEASQLQSLWTAYCVHNGLEVDTLGYDTDLMRIWESFHRSDSRWKDYDYDEFYNFMCGNLT